jgi:release factor glutamine methyltransferase
MTIEEALTLGRKSLANSSSPALDARLLLQDLLGRDHSYLVTRSDETLTQTQLEDYMERLRRAVIFEPIPYITGKAPFYGLTFTVTPQVLIPRPETEHLIEAVLRWANRLSKPDFPLTIADVGTGSGCIAIVLAKQLSSGHIVATDTSETALELARRNAANLGVSAAIRFVRGNLLDPVPGSFDLVVANLPYIADDEWQTLDESVRQFEPATALRGGRDGLQLITEVMKQARDRLNPGGAIFLEIGWRQGTAVKTEAEVLFPEAQVRISQDYGGRDRLLTIILPSK